jgi:hypothetical protein
MPEQRALMPGPVDLRGKVGLSQTEFATRGGKSGQYGEAATAVLRTPVGKLFITTVEYLSLQP